ncbi:hypothetical protein C8J56DRAFT_924008 [Mycena floridula]|nr:hypothetical protein C8J56DRAFT_924008 [Mycena floridula]
MQQSGSSQVSDAVFAADTVAGTSQNLGINDLLTSNKCPSHIQKLHISEAIAERLQSLRELDDRIAAVRKDLELLEEERAAKDKDLQRYKSVIHPIRRIPTEILSEIFLTFADEEVGEFNLASSLDPRSMNWIFSLVSSYWRSVAVSLPQLWSTVRISHDDLELEQEGTEKEADDEEEGSEDESDNKDDEEESDAVDWPTLFQRPLTRLEIQLQRSASRQLTVSFINSESIANVQPHPVLQMLLPTAPRWKALLYHTGSFGSYPCHEIVQIILLLPNLEILDIICKSHENDILHVAHVPVRLPFLRKLVLRSIQDFESDHPSDECHLLRQLTLPALRELEIAVYESTTPLQALLHRSGCSLDQLSLELHDFSDDYDCIELLREMPSLTSFRLSCSQAQADKFMDAIIGDPSVTPRLQLLSFDGQFDPTKFTQLQISRPVLSLA